MSKDKHTNRGNVKISVYCVYRVLLRPCKHSTLFHLKPAFKNGQQHSDSLSAFLSVITPAGSQQASLCHNLAWAPRLALVSLPCIAANSRLAALLARSHPQTAICQVSTEASLLLRGGCGRAAWDATAARRQRHRLRRLVQLPAWTGLRAAPPRSRSPQPTGLVPPPNLCQTAGTWSLVHLLHA